MVRGVDPTELYRSSHVRVCERLSALSPARLAATVPATPLWTAADLVAHVTGVASDAALGRLDREGVGSPEWTAEQIAKRAGRSMAEVVEEWRECVAKLDPPFDERIVRDLLTHEADLSGAVGKDDAPPPEAVSWMLDFALPSGTVTALCRPTTSSKVRGRSGGGCQAGRLGASSSAAVDRSPDRAASQLS